MRRLGLLGLGLGFLAAGALAAPSPEVLKELATNQKGAADHPLTGRYEGAVLLTQTVKAFDEITLPSGPAEGKSYDANRRFAATTTAQGKVTRSLYVAPEGRSSLEILANHRQALVDKGFVPLFECAREACGESFPLLKYRWDNKASLVRGEGLSHLRGLVVDSVFDQVADPRYALLKRADPAGDTLVAIYVATNSGGQFGDYSEALRNRPTVLIEVVEPRAMEQRIVTVSATEIGAKLGTEGRVAFYGIFFDFDRAELKPESEPQLAEMAKFLKGAAGARAFVIGHTDAKGALDYNLALSQRRAEAVVKALGARHGIDPKRLTPRGLGPLAPLASNRTEDGQARNRRVELVEQ